MPSIIQAWPEQETIVGYARRALFDHRHITPGIADTIPVAVLRAFAGRPEAGSGALVEDSLALLSHLEPELREVLAFELTQSAVTPSELVDTIAYWKADPDLPVRRTLLIGATRHLQAHQAAIHASGSSAHLPELDWLREQIRAGLCAYGPELEEDRQLAIQICGQLRHQGVGALVATGNRSLKSQLRQADRTPARFALIIGVAPGETVLKDLRSQVAEVAVEPDQAIAMITARLQGDGETA